MLLQERVKVMLLILKKEIKMNKHFCYIIILLLCWQPVFAQPDAKVVTDSDRSIEPAKRISQRPSVFDTLIPTPQIEYPLLVLREETKIEVQDIDPAVMRIKPQLSKLYNGYAKVGAGSRLMGLGEVYYNSLRSRKLNWGVHANHLSEWGSISDYAPSQYDRTALKAYGEVNEKRYTYGAEVDYSNRGLNYYGFQNPNADRDSIAQRFSNYKGQAFFNGHAKDSNHLNYNIGLSYDFFHQHKPYIDTIDDWKAREHNAALRSTWMYTSSNHLLLSNLKADFDIDFNNYKFGIPDSNVTVLDSGYVENNTLFRLRPTTHFFSKDNKFQFEFGGELAIDAGKNTKANLYPVGAVQYSLFNDLFIPYARVDGGVSQQRLNGFIMRNEFMRTNVNLLNLRRFAFETGIKGTLSKNMSFNLGFATVNYQNMGLFVNDTTYSNKNRFDLIYDTVRVNTIMGSLTYQHNETLKFDGILKWNGYMARNNAFAWNMPTTEVIIRGKYNVYDKLIVNLDFTLEGGRNALVYDANIEGVKEVNGQLVKPLGLIADANLGVEYRYTSRISFFANANNFAAQRYQRWFDYPVQAFQFMMGATFRF